MVNVIFNNAERLLLHGPHPPHNKQQVQALPAGELPQYSALDAVLPEEINLLSLIFEDLATRNPPDSKLTYENFVNFVGLTGLWASHLFHLFDETSTSLLGFEEFLYGIGTPSLTQPSA